MAVLQIQQLTKNYGHNRGVFDVTFDVNEGEVFGFLGPNGAGKTTTIRHIMGFSRPQNGTTMVNGINSWHQPHEIQKSLGYLPGEIALPENLTGNGFIKMMSELRGITDMSKTTELLKIFDLDPSGGVKRMSLGMKRKLAIVTAFMHDPQVLVLDEPTSGLDPLMQDTFIAFIKEEKRRGKTILLSSHIFSEVDATCDRISIIKDGRLLSTFVANDLKHSQSKTFKLEFQTPEELARFLAEKLGKTMEISAVKRHYNQVKLRVDDQDINHFFALVATYNLKFISEIKFTLEDYFMNFYDRNTTAEGA